jgi:sugar phosphate isomerase/epimerase
VDTEAGRAETGAGEKTAAASTVTLAAPEEPVSVLNHALDNPELESAMHTASRREFLAQTVGLGAAAMLSGPLLETFATAVDSPKGKFQVGLCTYLWGKDWDLPTVIANCEKAKVPAVELRTQHKHGVEPRLNAEQRREVKKRFADSLVTFVGIGCNEGFDSPDPARLKRSIEASKAFIQLGYDCGGSGTKVKPNDFHKDVPHEKTIEQIGRSLNVLGKFAANLGQQVRLEVHGSCCHLPVIKQIMGVADHPSVGVCWNCNSADLEGNGLEYNFNLVKNRLGATCHVRELNITDYPYQQLFDLLVKASFNGWMLLECRTSPQDLVSALAEQRSCFDQMLAKSLARP